MKNSINIIFPNQLFAKSQLLDNGNEVYLVEEFLFFRQYNFHKQKIAFHRASMKHYEEVLVKDGFIVHYLDAQHNLSDIRNFDKELIDKEINKVCVVDPVDFWLEKRLRAVCSNIELIMYDNPSFLNTKENLKTFFKPTKKSFFQTSFYKQQRKKNNILIDTEGEPEGGNWTYDSDNRKKYPKDKTPPPVSFPENSTHWKQAVAYTKKYFPDNLGTLSNSPIYPISHDQAENWFRQFLEVRFFAFGPYEDAIVKQHSILNHSLLSPLLNSGLILPRKVIDEALLFAKKEDIPINSTEGFVRQIIGWREFIRGMYECKGSFSRTKNFWQFDRKIPASFYDGSTGVEPIDETIKEVLKTGYCHHIERLMVLGNFMMLCEFHPDEVYKWFMELFIDAYDWVMVPNIYGMSQFADGGTFATKPYVGGSNYIKKMSNYKSGEWDAIWDGLFWTFIHKYQDFFKSNPRTSMIFYNYKRLSEEKKATHLKNAKNFTNTLLIS